MLIIAIDTKQLAPLVSLVVRLVSCPVTGLSVLVTSVARLIASIALVVRYRVRRLLVQVTTLVVIKLLSVGATCRSGTRTLSISWPCIPLVVSALFVVSWARPKVTLSLLVAFVLFYSLSYLTLRTLLGRKVLRTKGSGEVGELS